jgi:simple sugar transport system permease protein
MKGNAMAANAPQAHAAARAPRFNLARLRDFALIPALVILFVLGAFVSPSFLTEANLISILGASAALALVVLAESLIIITGKFDLSVESTVGIAPAVGAMLVIPAASGGFGTEWPLVCWRFSPSARWSGSSTASWWSSCG